MPRMTPERLGDIRWTLELTLPDGEALPHELLAELDVVRAELETERALNRAESLREELKSFSALVDAVAFAEKMKAERDEFAERLKRCEVALHEAKRKADDHRRQRDEAMAELAALKKGNDHG